MNVGVFLPNWIGDVVMAVPTLRALRKLVGAEGRLVGVMRPYVAQVLDGTPWLHDQLFYDPKSKNRDFQTRALVQRLLLQELDAVVLLTNSLRTGVLAWLSGAPRRIGCPSFRGPLLTGRLRAPTLGRTCTASRAHRPRAGLLLRNGLCAGVRRNRRSSNSDSTQDRAAADAAWQALQLPADRKVVVFIGGASVPRNSGRMNTSRLPSASRPNQIATCS
jgi:heptosyltransferase-2